MNNITVQYNNLEFKFYTFEDSFLQSIQLQKIESEMIQAVGRSRLLRENATVSLFSSFPLMGATYMNFDD